MGLEFCVFMKNKETRRICFACDLKDDQNLINEYKKHHSPGAVWREVISSIKESGIVDMQIFCVENRLFMIIEVDNSFDADLKTENDAKNPMVQEWEKLMWKYQQSIPGSPRGLKWVEMERIFELP